MTRLVMWIAVLMTLVTGVYFLILYFKIDKIENKVDEIERKMEGEE